MNYDMTEHCFVGYNAEKLPLGKLSKATISKVSYLSLWGWLHLSYLLHFTRLFML